MLGMRPSPLRHPLAVLRQLIGISQKEMADHVDRTPATIQAIELKKLNLSEDLAAKIEEETGVSAAWLLAGDVTRPIQNRLGARYLKNDYDMTRAREVETTRARRREKHGNVSSFGLLNGERLACVFAAAMQAKPSKFQVAMFLAHKWLEEMQQKFGEPTGEYLKYRSRAKVSRVSPNGSSDRIRFPSVYFRTGFLELRPFGARDARKEVADHCR